MKKFINTLNKVFWVVCIAYYVFLAVAFIMGCVKSKKDRQAARRKADEKEEMFRKEFDEEFKADLEAMKKRRSEYMDSRESIADVLKKNSIFSNDELNEKLRKAGWDSVSPQAHEEEKE